MFEKKKQPVKKNTKSAEALLAELDAQILEEKPIEEPKEEPKAEKQSVNKKNGHKAVNKETIKETIEVKTEEVKPSVPVVDATEQLKQLDQERKLAERAAVIEADAKRRFYESIPGYGYLFGIKSEFLPESTNIDKMQSWMLALGYLGEFMLDNKRTESIFVSWAEMLMRLQNSVEGKSRTDVLEARRQEAEKAAAGAVREGLAGGR